MDSTRGSIYYCSVLKSEGFVLFSYSNGDGEIENLAEACMERAPLFHKWYTHTSGKKTFAFLMDDGYVFFCIADERLGNQRILQFLRHVKDEFKKIAKKYAEETVSPNLRHVRLQEKFTPIVLRLITLQESVSDSGIISPAGTPSPLNGKMEVSYPTHAPLLGKANEKKKSRDHVTRRDIELEERRKSTDKCVKVDLSNFDANSRVIHTHGSASPLPKDFKKLNRSSLQSIRANWCRQVRIILAIDAIVCVILLVIWLFICHGIECVR